MSTVQNDCEKHDEFPVGPRVLAVDDDPVRLKKLESRLRRRECHVTAVSQALNAIKLLREEKDQFDLVISNVHMPDMDGFLHLRRMGRDLPVILMPTNCDPKIEMEGNYHDECDYLLKSTRIWQHMLTRTFESASERMKEKGLTPEEVTRQLQSLRKDKKYQALIGQKRRDATLSSPHAPEDVPERVLEMRNVEEPTREEVARPLQVPRYNLRSLRSAATQHANLAAGKNIGRREAKNGEGCDTGKRSKLDV